MVLKSKSKQSKTRKVSRQLLIGLGVVLILLIVFQAVASWVAREQRQKTAVQTAARLEQLLSQGNLNNLDDIQPSVLALVRQGDTSSGVHSTTGYAASGPCEQVSEPCRFSAPKAHPTWAQRIKNFFLGRTVFTCDSTASSCRWKVVISQLDRLGGFSLLDYRWRKLLCEKANYTVGPCAGDNDLAFSSVLLSGVDGPMDSLTSGERFIVVTQVSRGVLSDATDIDVKIRSSNDSFWRRLFGKATVLSHWDTLNAEGEGRRYHFAGLELKPGTYTIQGIKASEASSFTSVKLKFTVYESAPPKKLTALSAAAEDGCSNGGQGIPITLCVPGSTVSGDFMLSASASDAPQSARIRLLVDGNEQATCVGNTTCLITVSTAFWTPGSSHFLQARIRRSGTPVPEYGITVYMANAKAAAVPSQSPPIPPAPISDIPLTPLPPAADSNMPELTVDGPADGSQTTSPFTEQATASSFKGMKKVVFWLDGAAVAYRSCTAPGSAAPILSCQATFRLANGRHTIEVVATDALQKKTTDRRTVTVGPAPASPPPAGSGTTTPSNPAPPYPPPVSKPNTPASPPVFPALTATKVFDGGPLNQYQQAYLDVLNTYLSYGISVPLAEVKDNSGMVKTAFAQLGKSTCPAEHMGDMGLFVIRNPEVLKNILQSLGISGLGGLYLESKTVNKIVDYINTLLSANPDATPADIFGGYILARDFFFGCNILTLSNNKVTLNPEIGTYGLAMATPQFMVHEYVHISFEAVPAFKKFMNYVFNHLSPTQQQQVFQTLITMREITDTHDPRFLTEFAVMIVNSLGVDYPGAQRLADKSSASFQDLGNGIGYYKTAYWDIYFDSQTSVFTFISPGQFESEFSTMTLKFDQLIHLFTGFSAESEEGFRILKAVDSFIIVPPGKNPDHAFTFTTKDGARISTPAYTVYGVLVIVIPPGTNRETPDGGALLFEKGWVATVNEKGEIQSLAGPGIPPGQLAYDLQPVRNPDGTITYIKAQLSSGDSIRIYPGASNYITISRDPLTGEITWRIGDLIINDHGVVNTADGWHGYYPGDVSNTCGASAFAPGCSDYIHAPVTSGGLGGGFGWSCSGPTSSWIFSCGSF